MSLTNDHWFALLKIFNGLVWPFIPKSKREVKMTKWNSKFRMRSVNFWRSYENRNRKYQGKHEMASASQSSHHVDSKNSGAAV